MHGRYTCFGITFLFLAMSFLDAFAEERLGVQRYKYESAAKNRYITVEILDDDLAHFEISETRTDTEPGPARKIYVTPMVNSSTYGKYPGPSRLGFIPPHGGNTVETNEMKISIEDDAQCVSVFDKKRNARLLSLCGENLNQPTKGLRIARGDMQNV